MKESEPSVTAQGAAALRAAHLLIDGPPAVFADRLAIKIINEDTAAAITADPALFQTPHRRRQRAGVVARSRIAEDRLAALVAGGLRQYVLLGAGLDSFAYRNPHEGLRVFEIDHPATHGWKRERIAGRGITAPASLTFVPVDFEQQSLEAELRRSPLDWDAPVFLSWLGVVTYLTREAAMETLGVVSRLAKGSQIVFTFSSPLSDITPDMRADYEQAAQRVADLGEPWRTQFEPAALADDLTALGFSTTEILDPDTIIARYFAARTDGLRPGPAGHLMLATV